ncbi:MAG: hypothetical protein KJ025_10600 [Burkholderiales bacterium]|nr:hypothetical protein [Burkholderiales bacterium]
MCIVRVSIACLLAALLGAPAAAQPVAPGAGYYYPPGYYPYGCSGIYLELARQNDELLRIRSALRRLETESDDSQRARQWIAALEAENRNLRQQNALFQRRVLELEAALEAAPNGEPHPAPR